MASQLILDKKDPGVAELVSAWEDGGEYDIGGLKCTQVKTVGDLVYFDITEIPSAEGAEPEEEGAYPPGGKETMKGKPKIMIAFGH